MSTNFPCVPKTISFKNKVLRALWNITVFFLFRPFGTNLFRPWRMFLLRLFGADVQSDSGVYASTQIWAPWNLKLGHNAWLGPHVICYNMDKIEIGNDVTVSQWAYLCAASHDISEVNNPVTSLITAPIVVKDKVWIGARAFIGMGVCIGEGAVVGATASVFKSVDDYCVVGGNPAKVIKYRKLNNTI
jgi:putative colanic acid biosynthesis acetyltransferase WcaF